MDQWIDCKECKVANGGYSNGLRCIKHQMMINQQMSGIAGGFYPITPKSDMEIIIERLAKIERMLMEISPIRNTDIDKMLKHAKDNMDKVRKETEID
jgi:hypothetical protein